MLENRPPDDRFGMPTSVGCGLLCLERQYVRSIHQQGTLYKTYHRYQSELWCGVFASKYKIELYNIVSRYRTVLM